MVKRVVRLWVTRDPTLTDRLFFFTAMFASFLTGASLLGPKNPLEFGRDNLFSTVMGVTPQWVLNREQGPVQATLLTSAAACAAAIAKIRLGNNMIPLSPFMHGVLGLPVGFMLVFRWNNAYERWWSGRTELGLLLMHSKNLGGQFCTWVAPADQQLATRALALICALKECVADRLNGTVLKDGSVMLNATSLSTPLHPEDLEGLFAADNKVLFCIEQLRNCIYDAWNLKVLPPPTLAGMLNEDLFGIMHAYGECEKVVNQPPPGCIITHLKSTLMVYVCTLPFILVHEVGVWAVVPTTALLSLALFGTEAAAEQIEQPFGNRPYHLPVRGLIINNTRDLGQTSRPVLGFSGYVNSPRDFSQSPDVIPSLETPADEPFPNSGPLLFGAADAWERADPASSERDGAADANQNGRVEPPGRLDPSGGASDQNDGDENAVEAHESAKVSLPSRTEDDAGVLGMGVSTPDRKEEDRAASRWGPNHPYAPESSASSAESVGKKATSASAGAADAWFASSPGLDRRDSGAGVGVSSWGSSASAYGLATGTVFKLPAWKAQTPIEVFEDNDIKVDVVSGAEKLGTKHRYHVGDSKRRKTIDAAGFRDDSAIPHVAEKIRRIALRRGDDRRRGDHRRARRPFSIAAGPRPGRDGGADDFRKRNQS